MENNKSKFYKSDSQYINMKRGEALINNSNHNFVYSQFSTSSQINERFIIKCNHYRITTNHFHSFEWKNCGLAENRTRI